jgi:acyl-CoA reductase-like NAD-dependent aldehyde dehydrogenase
VRYATERVLVHERVHDEFLDEVVEAAAAGRPGDPFDDKTPVGPMNNEPTAPFRRQ